MAWLIVRVCDDRQGKNTIDLFKQRSKLCTPTTEDVAHVAERFGVEVHTTFPKPATHKEWPWSVVAYTSRSRDGIGRSGGQFIHLPAKPKPRSRA